MSRHLLGEERARGFDLDGHQMSNCCDDMVVSIESTYVYLLVFRTELLAGLACHARVALPEASAEKLQRAHSSRVGCRR